jgi:hypothetical protein
MLTNKWGGGAVSTVAEFMRIGGCFDLAAGGVKVLGGDRKRFRTLVIHIAAKVGDDDAESELCPEAEEMFVELRQLVAKIESCRSQ